MPRSVLAAGLLAGSVSGSTMVPADLHVRANQVGYAPGSLKLGVAMGHQDRSGSFAVVDAASGEQQHQAAVRNIEPGDWGPFSHHLELDFSAFDQAGVYRLKLGEAWSHPFRIGNGIHETLIDANLEFMRQQRCGYNPWLDVVCHPWDGRTAYGGRTNGTYLDARGGWHDAADLLKYLLTSSQATAQLLLAWELAADRTGAASGFRDRVNGLGQSAPNAIPDLLDEARWGLEWMLKLHPEPGQLFHQVADDRDHAGWRLPQDEIADYGWGRGGYRVVYAADGKPQGLGGFQSESTGVANLAGRYAAAMALAYQAWSNDPMQRQFAKRCLQAGREVYELGKAQEGVQQGNSYGAPYRYAETTWADDMEWGATELFLATGEMQYLRDAKRYAEQAGAESWMGREEIGHYQYYPFVNIGHFRLHPLVGPELRAKLAGYYREGLERCAAVARRNPYGIGVPFIWCSNNLVIAIVTQGLFYQEMTGSLEHAAMVSRHRDWLLGRNPWGTTMFTGIGSEHPEQLHLMTTQLTGRRVRGGLVDGPVRESIFLNLKGVSLAGSDPMAAFQDARAVYHDDPMDYATNEPIMDGTAAAVLMWSVLSAH